MSKKSRPVNYFTDMDVKTKYTPGSPRLYDHESLFSFCNDSGNSAFLTWWDVAGKTLYGTWVENNLEILSEEYY
jgi:hypothetical protein